MRPLFRSITQESISRLLPKAVRLAVSILELGDCAVQDVKIVFLMWTLIVLIGGVLISL
jgi:hypothetical protein